MTILSDWAPKFILMDTELTHFHLRGPLLNPLLWAVISSSDHTFHLLTGRFITTFLSLKTLVSAPRKVSILTHTTAVRVLSTLLGIPGICPLSLIPPINHNIRDV